MKQNNSKQEENKTPEKMNGGYGALISELALDEMFKDAAPEAIEKNFTEYLKTVISELAKLSDLTGKIEKDPRMALFLERLIAGEERKTAFEESGLAGLTEGLPAQELSVVPKEVLAEASGFFTEKGIDKKSADEFIAFVETVVSKICEDEIGPDVLEVLWLAFTHENDVKKSYDEGVIKGQNKKIESLRFERNNVDGLGAIGGGAVSVPQEKKMGYIERLMKNN